MGNENRRLHSPDPLDQRWGPLDRFLEPLDQPNANGLKSDLILASDFEEEPELEEEPKAAPIDVRAMRKRLRITQRQFAGWFGFPVATLRHWERGNRVPCGTALVLLHVIRDNPRAVLQAVRKARRAEPSIFARIEETRSLRAPMGYGDRRPPLHPRGPRKPR